MSTLKVDTILKRSGTGTITLGQSGDTLAIPAGATIANSGTATGFGGVMTPAFEAYKASSSNVSDNTAEKIAYDTESFDVGGCYDHSSNYRFTPTTAGKYFVYHTCWMSTEANGNFEVMWAYIYKNGSSVARQSISAYSSNALRDCSLAVCSIIDMNGSSDYVEAYGQIDDNNMSSNPRIFGTATGSKFGAYKIIE
jgi:hypothetical protein